MWLKIVLTAHTTKHLMYYRSGSLYRVPEFIHTPSTVCISAKEGVSLSLDRGKAANSAL